MLVSNIVDAVKAVLRTENIPLTDDEIATMVGRVAVKLTSTVPLLPVVDYFNTDKGEEYALPSDYVFVERAIYKPSASSIITAINIPNKELTLNPAPVEAGYERRGVLKNLNSGAETNFERLDATNVLRVEDLSGFNIGDRVEEKKDFFEMRIGAYTEPNDNLIGVYAPENETNIGVFGRFLRLSPDKKMGYHNLQIHAFVIHPVIATASEPLLLSRMCDNYLIYQTAYLILAQFMGEEAPALLEQMKREANEALKILMSSAPAVQQPQTITVANRTYRKRIRE